MKKEPTMTMSIKVPLSLKLQIEMAANKDGRTINSLVNKVLKDFIEAKKNRRAFRSPILYNFFFFLSIIISLNYAVRSHI